MNDRISATGNQIVPGFDGVRPASAEGRRVAAPTTGGGGDRREGGFEFRGKVNLRGPFDADAPRGTYLDILV